MNQNELFKDLNTGLPSDIQKLKDSGKLDAAIELINNRLEENAIPTSLKNSLLLQKDVIERIPLSYTVSFSDALKEIQEIIPSFTSEMLSSYLVDRAVDWTYINGEVYLLTKYLDTLKKYDSFNNLIPNYVKTPLEETERYRTVTKIKTVGKSQTRIRIKHSIKLKDECFKYGMNLLVHIPIPIPCEHQSEIRIEYIYPKNGVVSSESSLQRTVSWQVELDSNTEFDKKPPAFKDCITSQLYQSIYARILIRKCK